MATISELRDKYQSLDQELPAKGEEVIDSSCLLTFQYEYLNQQSQVEIDTDEFTAVCPWTGLPDYGVLTISCLLYTSDAADALLCVDIGTRSKK